MAVETHEQGAGGVARRVLAIGANAAHVSAQLCEALRAPDLRLAIVFSDWQLDPDTLASELHRNLAPATVIGGTTIGVIANDAPATADAAGGRLRAVALGLYGDWLRVGVGVAHEISRATLNRSRDAVHHALSSLRRTTDALDPSRHLGLTLFDGHCGAAEAFCIGSAVAAPQIRFVGGAVATDLTSDLRPVMWVDGKPLVDAGVIAVLECQLPFHPVTSAHLTSTPVKTVVTAVSARGRIIDELDGRPAAMRFHELIASLGEEIDPARPSQYSFARYVDNNPYVRSLTRIDGSGIHLASGVEAGHVLRVMRPGDLIGTTRRDLAAAAERVGGAMAAFLAFSCIGRHWEAAARDITSELADTYAQYPTVGAWSFGEQAGLLLVNHTLTGLAIGATPLAGSRRPSATQRAITAGEATP